MNDLKDITKGCFIQSIAPDNPNAFSTMSGDCHLDVASFGNHRLAFDLILLLLWDNRTHGDLNTAQSIDIGRIERHRSDCIAQNRWIHK